jgi:hypothetical protein
MDNTNFANFLKSVKSKKVHLFMDIETLTINKKAGKIKPSMYHSVTYSVAVAFFSNPSDDLPYYAIFNTFKDFFEFIFKHGKKKPDYILNFHNGNKYDHHFLTSEVARAYPLLKIENAYLRNAIQNDNTYSKSVLTWQEKEDGIILEKRVKSSNNLELELFLNNYHFYTIDNYVKTNASIATIGKKLKDHHFITEEYLKTSFDYTKYDLEEDLSPDLLSDYVSMVFNQLSESELIYIRNDVIILALCVKHYSTLFFGFDYNEMTFTSNIKKMYIEDNPLAQFQLLKKVRKHTLKNTDYHFHNLNFFNYLNNFYRGGLNLYNDQYISTILENGFSIDINSSYPFVMYFHKMPTILRYYGDFEEPTPALIQHHEDFITFFTIRYEDLNEIISTIPSNIIRKMIVKYYPMKNGEVYISSVFIDLLNKFLPEPIDTLPITSFVTYECLDFGAKDIISHNYFIKTQGKNQYEIDYQSPINISVTENKNPYVFSATEVAGSKVLLNGIYGIPALRANFDLFRRDEKGNLYNIENGFENSERNIIFSAAVTAYAFYNLLYPLAYIPIDKIDDYFWYCDTDSLYLSIDAKQYLPSELFHPYNLGKWDIENEHIEQFYILNHKKYCYYANNKIKVKCGGVRNDSFNFNMDFKTFIKSQFSSGTKIKSIRAIRNEWNTISLYDTWITLDEGLPYPEKYDPEIENYKQEIIVEAKKELQSHQEESTSKLLYIETNFGTISTRDFIPEKEQGIYALKYYIKTQSYYLDELEKMGVDL